MSGKVIHGSFGGVVINAGEGEITVKKGCVGAKIVRSKHRKRYAAQQLQLKEKRSVNHITISAIPYIAGLIAGGLSRKSCGKLPIAYGCARNVITHSIGAVIQIYVNGAASNKIITYRYLARAGVRYLQVGNLGGKREREKGEKEKGEKESVRA
jgi:hypothetical protein